MNELLFATRIRHTLNQGTRLEPGTAERLRVARERALSAYRPVRARAPALATAGGPAHEPMNGIAGILLRALLALAVVAVSAVALTNGQQRQRMAEIEEIDAELLTDDLPIDALLDRGFETWLKKRAAR